MSDAAKILAEMRRTLLAEFGARAIYSHLARFCRDQDLQRVLLQLRADEEEQVRGMTQLIESLGGRAPRRSLRRNALAGVLAGFGALFGMRLALRICCDAERTASRWYATYQSWFQARGELEQARLASRLGMTKHRHAEALATWIEHAPRRLTKS